MRWTLRCLVVAIITTALFATTPPAHPQASCTPRLLVLSAFPAEIGPLLAELDRDAGQPVTHDGRRFYTGTLRGNRVVLALTGIGLSNAAAVAHTAFESFPCEGRDGITGVVFSGVAGGRFIGDVSVPTRWTEDGSTWIPVDEAMLAAARRVAEPRALPLRADATLGDPACLCHDPHSIGVVALGRTPQMVVGGDGLSADPFGGRRFPCAPGGGDVFGCDPCGEDGPFAEAAVDLIGGLVPFVDPEFLLSYLQMPPTADPAYAAQDMESAAVARVAAELGVPFIAFRGVSDGDGDPLGLPGFPVQFFVYRQLAADNAAAATLAFLELWASTSP